MKRSMAALITLLFAVGLNAQTEFGDTLFSFNAGALTPTEDYSLMGVEFADDHYWITGMNAPYYDHRLYKISADGGELVSYTSLGTGYHAYFDLAYDGEYLYATDRDSIVQIDMATGELTGERILADFDYLLVQGIAYDPATDHFWVMPQRNAQLQIFYEIDRQGNILNSYPNLNTDYTAALAWDTLSPGGPYLWTIGREEIGFDSRPVMRQFNPASGEFTGVEIEMKNRSPWVLDYPLGLAYNAELDSSTATIIALQAGAIDFYDGLDWIVVYDADLRDQQDIGAEITVTPPSIQLQLQHGDTLDVPVVIGNTGSTNLTWSGYIENTDSLSFPDGELGDPLFGLDLTGVLESDTARFYGLAYARDHFWLSGYIFPDERLIFKVNRDGELVATYPQPSFFGAGWSAIATDGDFLYAPEQYVINIWSLDSLQTVGTIFTGSITADAMTYDPNRKYIYYATSTGAIFVIDMEGEEVSLLVTQYEIEGLAWDNYSPDGPFLWAWVNHEDSTIANCQAVRLDPETGIYTGVSFDCQEFGSFPNQPEAAAIYPEPENGRLVFAGLQVNDYPEKESFIAGYDLDVVPPPAWIQLLHPTLGSVEAEGEDTLIVRFHAMMDDTTTQAIIRIQSNDIDQPVVEIPVSIEMLEGVLTNIGEDGTVPLEYVLHQNYPNPFNPTTTIEYFIPGRSELKLVVYDVLGQRVETLVDDIREAGRHKVVWDARRHASGVYFVELQVDGFAATRKMFLVR